MNELNHTLDHMGIAQLLLALVFIGAYALMLGGFIDGRAQTVSGVIAALSAAGFVALTDPWVHGVLLAAAVIVGMGLFIAFAWLLTALARRATGMGPELDHGSAFAADLQPEDYAPAADSRLRADPRLSTSAPSH